MKPTPKAPTTTERPRPLDVLVGITESAIAFRFADRTPTISDVARVVAQASRVMHIRDLDERISVENAAVMAFAKQRGWCQEAHKDEQFERITLVQDTCSLGPSVRSAVCTAAHGPLGVTAPCQG